MTIKHRKHIIYVFMVLFCYGDEEITSMCSVDNPVSEQSRQKKDRVKYGLKDSDVKMGIKRMIVCEMCTKTTL